MPNPRYFHAMVLRKTTSHLQQFLNNVIHNEKGKEKFTCHDKIFKNRHITQQLYSAETPGRDRPSGGRELHGESHHAEEIDVSVVHGEIDEHGPRASRKPAFRKQVLEDPLRICLGSSQVLHKASPAVRGQLTFTAAPV